MPGVQKSSGDLIGQYFKNSCHGRLFFKSVCCDCKHHLTFYLFWDIGQIH